MQVLRDGPVDKEALVVQRLLIYDRLALLVLVRFLVLYDRIRSTLVDFTTQEWTELVLVEVHEELHTATLLLAPSIDTAIHVAESLERGRHHGLDLFVALRALDGHIEHVYYLLVNGYIVVLIEADEHFAHALEEVCKVDESHV